MVLHPKIHHLINVQNCHYSSTKSYSLSQDGLVGDVTSKLEEELLVQIHSTNLAFGDSKHHTTFCERVHHNTTDYHIGKGRVEFEDGKIILYNDEKKIKIYRSTPELRKILFLKNPYISKLFQGVKLV